MHPGTPTSVPVPLLVYAVASRTAAELQPLPSTMVTLHRAAAEAELAESADQHAVLVEQRILPWSPARDDLNRSSPHQYTVGYCHGDHHIPWGLSFSTERSAIEIELAEIRAAIAESNADESFEVVMLERPIYPWYLARPRATNLA